MRRNHFTGTAVRVLAGAALMLSAFRADAQAWSGREPAGTFMRIARTYDAGNRLLSVQKLWYDSLGRAIRKSGVAYEYGMPGTRPNVIRSSGRYAWRDTVPVEICDTQWLGKKVMESSFERLRYDSLGRILESYARTNDDHVQINRWVYGKGCDSSYFLINDSAVRVRGHNPRDSNRYSYVRARSPLLENWTAMRFDSNGRVAASTLWQRGLGDNEGHPDSSSYSFSSFRYSGDTTRETIRAWNHHMGAFGFKHAFEVRTHERLLQVHADGDTMEFVKRFDRLGRPVQKIMRSRPGARTRDFLPESVWETTYSYDARGRVVREEAWDSRKGRRQRMSYSTYTYADHPVPQAQKH